MATVQYTAIQCPSIVTLASFYSRADAYSAPGTNVPVSQTITAGDTNLVSKFDANALGTDLASAYGGGGFAVARGLTLSIGSGLNITVAKGHAAIAGVVSQPAVTPYVVYNRLSKLLAQYHIALPRKFLEGDKGVEVFEIRQIGRAHV